VDSDGLFDAAGQLGGERDGGLVALTGRDRYFAHADAVAVRRDAGAEAQDDRGAGAHREVRGRARRARRPSEEGDEDRLNARVLVDEHAEDLPLLEGSKHGHRGAGATSPDGPQVP
jgi:hypothetical protein